MKTIIAVAMLACLLAVANAYTHHMGPCPDVVPRAGFDMNKFLGYWHVIEKSSTGSRCDGYNYTAGDESGKYVLRQDSDRRVFGLSALKYRTHYTGNLTVPDPSTPAHMRVRFPLNLAGAASYIVFATDYDHYAGVFVCQQFRFTHRRNIALLSRGVELESATLDNLHQLLESFGVDGDYLSFVPQSSCGLDKDLVEIDINPNTFSKENVRKIFGKAGKKIREGAEWVKNASSSVYHKILGTESDQDGETDPNTVESSTTLQNLEESLFEEYL